MPHTSCTPAATTPPPQPNPAARNQPPATPNPPTNPPTPPPTPTRLAATWTQGYQPPTGVRWGDTARVSVSTRDRHQHRWWRRFLLAAGLAIAALVVGLVGAAPASAATLPDLETRVGASTPAMAYIVGVHESVSAGQRWCHAPPQAQTTAGCCVAANSVRLGATYERLYEGGGGVLAQVDEAGILNLAIERGVATPSGGAMFNEAMSAVGPVNGIRGTWTTSMPSNLDAFNANIRAGMSVQDAARSTFTGTMAGRSGFTTVSVEQLTGSPGAYTNVKVVFGR